MDPGRNDVVPGSLGRGPSEHGRLDLEEPVLLQILPGEVDELAPEDHGLDHIGPPEVQVPVLHPDVLVGKDALLLVSELERGQSGPVQELGVRDEDLDLAGGVPGVLGALDPLPDDSVDLHAGLAGERLHDRIQLRGVGPLGEVLWVEDDLCNAVSVREVDERDSAVVPGKSNPTLEAYLLPEVGGPQLTAGVCSSHGSSSLMRLRLCVPYIRGAHARARCATA